MLLIKCQKLRRRVHSFTHSTGIGQTDRQTGRQAGRQANRWTDGLTALLKQYHALHALHAYAHMDVLLYEEILLYFPFHLFV